MHGDTLMDARETMESHDRWLGLDAAEHAALVALRASYEAVLAEIDEHG